MLNRDYTTPIRIKSNSNQPKTIQHSAIRYSKYNQASNESKETLEMSTPSIWGPSFWFTLHNGANHYPINPSPFITSRMKQFIRGIPVMLPCEKCFVHATTFIEKVNLDSVVRNRQTLTSFFIDFHNDVNRRTGKPVLSKEQAIYLYMDAGRFSHMKYN